MTSRYVAYEGERENGHRHGRGKMTSEDGIYEGEWKNGKMHGQGKATSQGGCNDEYVPAPTEHVIQISDNPSPERIQISDNPIPERMVNELLRGVYGFKPLDGYYVDTYEGDWDNGKKHGYGIQTKNSKETTGLWEYGTFIEELPEKLTCEMCCFRQKDIICNKCDKVVGCGVCCQKIHNDKCPNCRDEPWNSRKILY